MSDHDGALASLASLRVVELGVWVAAPSAAAMLADWGADVVKVEGPAGDPMRNVFGSLGIGDNLPNPAFALDNRGKRSVVLDLRQDEDRASFEELRAALDRTGVAACADLPARVLSAGQRRRVALARVLAMNATVWLLDEPYANLDAAGAELVSGLLQGHVESGGLALVVAHRDLSLRCNVRRLELNS